MEKRKEKELVWQIEEFMIYCKCNLLRGQISVHISSTK